MLRIMMMTTMIVIVNDAFDREGQGVHHDLRKDG